MLEQIFFLNLGGQKPTDLRLNHEDVAIVMNMAMVLAKRQTFLDSQMKDETQIVG